jgi:class 3 adenylate cyclase/tetratricopeptide (TPR) repeat protein
MSHHASEAPVVCSGCGTDNETGRKFCKECGIRLAVACPACGAANAADAKFCGECAARLAGATPAGAARSDAGSVIPAPATRPVAERRLVSVMFADLVGFTTLAEGRDAEDTRELLARYFDLAGDVVGRYGGVVEKFIGDAVMAVWGTPVAHEDDAERAVRAGLELVDAVRTLGPGISARSGVLTGEAAVTLGATNQGMVAGDLVNTASRLQSVAAPGTVLVGDATRRAAAGAITFEPAGEQLLKGKVAPVPAWRAMRVVAERGGRNRSEALEAPFVGRDDELRLLKDLFHATTRERRARLVSVFGPAGIGKTRLAWEFLKYVDGLAEAVWWHDGRSPAYGDGISFWALGEMVRSRCGLAQTDDVATTRARVAETVARHLADPAERAWVEPALLALLGIETGIPTEQLFGAWRTFFERLAANAPVVLVFEDFHHADSGLLDFVDHLLEWSRGVPLYVVTLSRPDLLERRPAWGAARRNFASLFLEPLGDEAMAALLRGLVPGLPDAAVRVIIARADGMPLYAVETVRMLLAEGRLALEGEAYRPVGDLADLAVPDTLTALIASRLDGLSAADRTLVSDAAVLGQSFTLAGLAAVSGIPEAELEPRAQALVRRELLRHEADVRSPERGQFAFVQALIREVAYNTLAKRDRRRRHLAAAGFFERLGTDELAGAIAGHYLAAHANSPEGPEADALAAQARVTLRAAAERATALGSHLQAVGFLEQALTVTREPTARAELLVAAGTAMGAAGNAARARGFLDEAIGLRRDGDDRRGACQALTELGRILLTSQYRDDALTMLEAAAAEFGDFAEDADGVALRTQLARGQFLTYRYDEAIATADAVLVVAERLDLLESIADLLVTKGSTLVRLGRPREAMGTIESGRRLAESLGLTFTVLRATLNGLAHLAYDDPLAAAAAAMRGADIAARSGLSAFEIMFREQSAASYCQAGRWDRAVEVLEEGLAHAPESERVHMVGSLAYIAILRGAAPEPLVEATRAVMTSEADVQQAGHLPMLDVVAGLVEGRLDTLVAGMDRYGALLAGEPPEPLHLVYLGHVAAWTGDAVALAGAIGGLRVPPRHARAIDAAVAGLTAALTAIEGRRDEARAGFLAAVRAVGDLELDFERALMATTMTILLGTDDAEVRAAAEVARKTFRETGAAPLLARLDAAMARGPVTA